MLDLKRIRAQPEVVREGLRAKGADAGLDALLRLDEERRAILAEADGLKQERNRVSEEIGRLKGAGGDAAGLMERMKGVASTIRSLDARLAEVDARLDALLLTLPNLPHESVPVGPDASHNRVASSWGAPRRFEFVPRDHWDLLEGMGYTDFERASKLSGSGFSLFRGGGAALVRALVRFMLDLHIREHGYVEIAPPYLVNRACMTGTGQLPRMEEDMYRTADDDLFLIPTAEVPVTNLHREEILEAGVLPIRYTAHTPCFRREAGAHGKETRGLNRVHQFDKVELVRITTPETSYEEHESLLREAEEVLRRLEIPYRVILLASGDLSFAAAKCYDLEAWSPAQQKWLEVSSCSNFEDFQARRMGLRYRPGTGEKARTPHTLNGSALALPRTLITLLENHQDEGGRVRVPAALRPYLDGREVLP